jgi:hypothetical protein
MQLFTIHATISLELIDTNCSVEYWGKTVQREIERFESEDHLCVGLDRALEYCSNLYDDLDVSPVMFWTFTICEL